MVHLFWVKSRACWPFPSPRSDRKNRSILACSGAAAAHLYGVPFRVHIDAVARFGGGLAVHARQAHLCGLRTGVSIHREQVGFSRLARCIPKADVRVVAIAC